MYCVMLTQKMAFQICFKIHEKSSNLLHIFLILNHMFDNLIFLFKRVLKPFDHRVHSFEGIQINTYKGHLEST